MPTLLELAGFGDDLPGIPAGIPAAMMPEIDGKKRKAPPPMTAARALEHAERLLAENKPQGAFLFARRAYKAGKAEKKSTIVKRATEIIKFVRGSAAVKMLAALGDIDGIIQGRKLGLW